MIEILFLVILSEKYYFAVGWFIMRGETVSTSRLRTLRKTASVFFPSFSSPDLDHDLRLRNHQSKIA